ncbi:choice-of-anchor D domain-containing protein [Myxococcota bacterium]|nr:choice-of-anchor D domain-containing protein [Myxococcota bacterium]
MSVLFRRTSSLPLLLGVLVAAGCNEDDGFGRLKGEIQVNCCVGKTPIEEGIDTIDFGDVQVGIAMTWDVVLKNSGDGAFSITSVELADSFSTTAYEFKLGDARFALAPQGTRNVSVSFLPYAEMEQAVESSFRIVTDIKANDAGTEFVTYTVRVRGRGVDSGLLVEPNPVLFGKVLVGSSSTLDVVVTNKLSIPVDVTTRLGGDGRPEIVNQGGLGRFELLSPVTATGSILPTNGDGTPLLLAPDASITVQVRYTPDPGQEDREDQGRWTLSNCSSPLCDVDVVLRGTGTNAAIECDPPSVDFGDVNPNTVVTKKTTCTNVATEEVTVTGWEMGPGSATEYRVTPYNGQPSRLTPGAGFDVEVQFAPTLASVGRNPAGSVVITGRNPRANRDLTPTRVAISGDAGGPDIATTPTMFNFGQVAIGTSSRKRLLVENTGYSALVITGVDGDADRTGAYSTDFGQGSQVSINPGESRIIQVTFTPATTGVVTSAVLISSDDADEGELRIPLTGEGVNLPPCSYSLSPTTINFGIVQVLHSTTQGLRIENTGANDCLINDIEIAPGSSSSYNLVNGNETGVILPPGQSKTIIVGYTPGGERTDMGTLAFYISDPTAPNVEVPLRGTGSASALLISPNEIDFGKIGVDCSTRDRTINIFNTGSQNTRIVRIERPAGVTTEFELDNLPAGLPSPPGAGVTITPGQSIDFVVRYHARDLGVDTGFLHVYEAGRTDPYVIPIYGEGTTDPTNEDRFTQLETPEVDILFVIDNSCSMSEEQTSLTSNFSNFIQFADSQALDYRIAVVTTDVDDVNSFGNCPNPLVANRPAGVAQGQCGYFADGDGDGSQTNADWRMISPDEQPSPELAFTAIATQGINGSGGEQGLQAAYQALSSPLITGWNQGFLRQSAYFALIFLSDEEDQSVNTVDFYTNYFQSIKGFRNTNLFSASAIVGPANTGCATADSGARYVEVARRTGGIFESICTTDWAQSLQNLGLSVFGYKSRFFLSNQPVPGTVEVTVDGVVIAPTAPSGQVRWSYDSATNSVSFAPLAIPEPGSEIVITYTAECL